MVHRLLTLLLAGIVAGTLAITPAAAGGRATDAPAPAAPAIDNAAALQRAALSTARVKVIVQLTDPAAAVRFRPAAGGRVDLASAAARAYAQQLADRQAAFIAALRSAVPAAQVIQRYAVVLNGLAVSLPGRDIPVLQRLAGVRAVTITRQFRPVMNISLPLIRASALWRDVGGERKAGEGMMIGIIDTGIDIRNPMFDDRGYRAPSGFPRSDTPGNLQYTNKKVIVARAYVGDAKDTIGHGSHVAGTSGGNSNTKAVVQGVSFTIEGVAPRAWLGNYNVFPEGAEFTSDEQIIAAIEDALTDGMHVINMSIGGTILTPTTADPVVIATNNAVDAGMIAAVAAGNSGPGAGTVTSPGNAEKAITAGASTNPHFLGQPVNVTGPGTPPSTLQNMGAAAGDFAVYESTTEAPFVWWGATSTDDQACTPVVGTPLSGKLALISRGTCPFTTKVRNAQNAGAIGVLIFNNVAGDPVAMGHDGTEPKPTIPAVMISMKNGEAMRDWYKANPTTAGARVDPQFAEFVTDNADIIAGFSSRGPTTFDNLMKPDLTAPGVNVLSAINAPTGFAFFQGTSMASPHVAGSAALLKQKNPTWSPQQVKSALMSTGKRPVTDHVTGSSPTGVMTRGGGRIDLGLARDPRGTFDPASVNFGIVALNTTVSRTFTVTGVNGGGAWTVGVSGPFRPNGTSTSDVAVSVIPQTVTLASGSTATVRVTVHVSLVAVGQYEGDIVLTGTTTLRVPFWLSVGPP